MSFGLADILEFRRDNAEISGSYRAMSDAELDLEALKRARIEVLADANQAAIEMSQAQQRMDRYLARANELQGHIEVAEILLAAGRASRV